MVENLKQNCKNKFDFVKLKFVRVEVNLFEICSSFNLMWPIFCPFTFQAV